MKKFLSVAIAIVLSFSLLIGCNKETDNIIKASSSFSVLNSGFESELGTEIDYEWDYYMSETSISVSKDYKTEGEESLKIDTLIGGYISVWQVLPIKNANYATKFDKQMSQQQAYGSLNDTRQPRNGDEIEMSMDIMIGGENFPEDLSLLNFEVKAENAKKVPKIIVKASDISLKPNEWTTIKTQAIDDGKIPDDSVLIVANFNMDIPEGAIVYIDNVKLYATKDGTEIEDTIPDTTVSMYDSKGEYLEISNSDFEDGSPFNGGTLINEGYFGSSSLSVTANSTAEMSISKGNLTNKTASAGVWVKGTTDEQKSLILKAKLGNNVVATSTASTIAKDKWVYLKTPVFDNGTSLSFDSLDIILKSETNSDTMFDFVQVGDTQRINGNKIKTAIMAYQPWFGTATEGNWGNWKYDSTVAGGRLYNPATIIGEGENQKRDIASVYYPLIGAYRSNSQEVINYQVSLIKGMGIDVIQANYYADLSSANYQKEVIDKLFIACEEQGLKMSVLYEPKIHLNGWISHNTRVASINAISDDIANFINKYKDNKALLQLNGVPMIEIFGVNLLTGDEWGTVIKKVQEKTSFIIPIMGDGIANQDYTNITSMFQWSLYNSSIASANASQAETYCKNNNMIVSDWAQANIGEKLAVGMIFPGFDDTPVRSWDTKPNSLIRKIDITGPEFYNASWSAFNNDKDNFDWIIIATFNDWTEGTVIEPTREFGHELAFITAKNIAEFKNSTSLTLTELENITNNYLNNRQEAYI